MTESNSARAVRLIARMHVAFWLVAGVCFAANISEITLPGTRVFPESITSTADGSLIVGSLGHGNILRIAPGQDVAKEWIKPGTGGAQQSSRRLCGREARAVMGLFEQCR